MFLVIRPWTPLFESTSAAANVGLSCGITQAHASALLKVVYILQMWIGRLEFMSAFVLIGFFAAFIRGNEEPQIQTSDLRIL